MKVPAQAGKVSGDSLDKIQLKNFPVDGVLDLELSMRYFDEVDGFRFDYLWRPRNGAKCLFVLFSGDANRERNNPPVFQRWSWASYFPGHCLYVSDPSLYLNKGLGLAWYSGTKDYDPLPRIRDRVLLVASRLGVDESHIYTYGSSGGGFAALRMAAIADKFGVVAVNPQIVVTNYESRNTEKYLKICFGGINREVAINGYGDRFSILNHIGSFAGRKIIYMQNILDFHHFKVHYDAFCKGMRVSKDGNETEGCFRRILFSHEGGHRKAETPDVFLRAMGIIEHWNMG